MRAVLDRLDERMREGLIKPTGRTGQGISAVCELLGPTITGPRISNRFMCVSPFALYGLS